jgi:hypothetical protein
MVFMVISDGDIGSRRCLTVIYPPGNADVALWQSLRLQQIFCGKNQIAHACPVAFSQLVTRP